MLLTLEFVTVDILYTRPPKLEPCTAEGQEY